jgi:hypothetical protein
MKNKSILILTLGLIFSGNLLRAQTLEVEKNLELTGKSKSKGYLGKVTIDDAKQQFDLVFVTKEKRDKVKFEVYKFDYNLNLVSNYNDEQEVSAARSKFSWFNFGGKDEEVYTGITAERNMSGKLVLKKIRITKKFNWWRGKYEYDKDVLDKEKPTSMDEDGNKRKLYYTAHQEISSSGELLVLALVNRGMLDMFKNGSREYLLMRFNKDLKIAEETKLTFSTPQCLVFSGSVAGSDPNSDNDGIFIFAPYGGQGYGKVEDPDPTNYTYVRTAPGGKIIERFNFRSECNYWAVMDVSISGNDVYVYGPGKIDKPERNYTKVPYAVTQDFMASGLTEEQRLTSLEEMKYSHLQIMKLSGGKLSFLTSVSIDDINSKAIKPPSQKKLYEFDGKRFVLSDINITASGDIFINGQDFSGKTGSGRTYKDFLMFQFDNTGTFKRFYGIQNTAKSPLFGPKATAIAASSAIIESPDGKSLFWQIYFVKDIDEDCSSYTSESMTTVTTYTTCYYTPLFQLKTGTIDIATGGVNDFKNYGGNDYYLYIDLQQSKGKDVPYIFINGGKQIVYIARERKGGIRSNERWGSGLWMGKFDPSKQ